MRISLVIAGVFSLIATPTAPGQAAHDQIPKIICPRVRPKMVKMVWPEYPKNAKKAGIESRVSLHCVVGKDGSVGSIEVLKGDEPFVHAVKTAVAQWKYKLVVLNGVAVEVDTIIDVIFECP